MCRSRRRKTVSSSRAQGREMKPQSTRPEATQSSISRYSMWVRTSKRMAGYFSRKVFISRGSQWTEMLLKVPTRMVPRVRPWSSATSSWSSRSALHTARSPGSRASPAAVRVTPDRPRRSRVTPHSCSRSERMRLTALWV